MGLKNQYGQKVFGSRYLPEIQGSMYMFMHFTREPPSFKNSAPRQSLGLKFDMMRGWLPAGQNGVEISVTFWFQQVSDKYFFTGSEILQFRILRVLRQKYSRK